MIKKLACLAFLALPFYAAATEKKPVNFFNVTVEKVFDGDTVAINLKEYPAIFGRISVRILGIDTAEMKSVLSCEKADALAARETLAKLLDGKRVDLLNCSRDKYFRLLCLVRVAETYDASTYMIKTGLARPYKGEKKQPWSCTVSH